MKYLCVLILVTFAAIDAPGQVSLSAIGLSYIQDFNTLPSSASHWVDNSTIVGWYGVSTSRDTVIADSGSSTTGGLHSYGAKNSTERALGALTPSSTSPIFAVRLINNTGMTINKFVISYTGEQWRQSVNLQTLSFSYQVGAYSDTTGTWTPYPGLDFTALKTGSGASNGNSAGNYSTIRDSINVTVNPGEETWLRWCKTGTSSPGLAIDDFSVTPIPDDSPLPVTMKGAMAKVEAGKVCLSFSTATEVDIAGFESLAPFLRTDRSN